VLPEIENVDGVIHLAAVSRAATAESDPDVAHAVNVDGTRNVLEALRSTGSPAWFVFASSREVYGEPERLPVSESHPMAPKGTYGGTKAEAEGVVRSYCRSGARRGLILRLTNLFGGVFDYPDRVVPAFLSAARRGEPLEVRGPGILLDLLHMADAVAAFAGATLHLSEGPSNFDVVNIASGRGVTLGDLARKIAMMTGSSSSIRSVAPAPWASSGYVGDVTKAAQLLSWRPRISLEDGLRSLAVGSSLPP
jgi:dTDP-glucose 4,6-dehydratase/UDP-glucose 4-epimerase